LQLNNNQTNDRGINMGLNDSTLKKTAIHRAIVLAIASASIFSMPLLAQDAVLITGQQLNKAAEKDIETIQVTGSRRQTQSVADIPSPVDILDIDMLSRQAGGDMSDLMKTLVPSFNVTSHPISGTSSLVRPPNLRGLGADHTLVLLNGKRHHRAANIPNFSGGINDGTQGADISSFPVIALKRVEVLREGAAAQYGADAIAGIMNFVANDDPSVRSIEVKTGQYYKGDGDALTIAATFGFELPNDGSINFSAEFNESDSTDRAQQSSGSQAFVDAGYTEVRDPAILWGAPEIKDDLKFFINLVAPVNDNATIYSYANYNKRENISGFFFRNPAKTGVFALGDERIVFDTTGDQSGNCPALINPDLNDPTAVAADLAAIETLRSDPNCFSFLEDFPGGTAPMFSGISEDLTFGAGVRGEFDNEVSYDVSYVWGENEVTYTTFDNFNPTFGPDSPNRLFSGSRVQTEQTFNAELIYPAELGLASPVNIAVGFEWHEEEYTQNPGQVEAYGVGDYTETAQGTTGISVGTLGFGSFSPANSYSNKRDNIALYIDVETDVTDEWTLGAAVRYEDFSDVGNDTNYKISTLYRLTDDLNVRATVSTGFHVPTPGQNFYAQSTVGFNAEGELTTKSSLPVGIVGQLPSFSDTATPLTPETSDNLGLGFVWTTEEFNITVDYFRIDLSDRITLTQVVNITDADRDVLVDIGFSNANQFTGVNHFTNDFDTRTQGVDVVIEVPLDIIDGASTSLKLSGNYTDTEVTKQGPDLSDLRLKQLEEQLPNSRASLSFNHSQGQFRTLARVNYTGSLTEYYLSETRVTDLDSQITVDLEVSYQVTESLELITGGQNIFDSFPTKSSYGDSLGSTYPISSPNGFGGGYYYVKAKYRF
jgi:iron complex outermembrane receptor protein